MGNCGSEPEDDHDERGATTRKTILNNMMRERQGEDVFKYYKVTKVLGEGSMGSVSSVRKKASAVGGSAYKKGGGGIFGVFKAKKKNHILDHVDSDGGSSEHGREYALKTIQLNRITDEFIEELRNEIDILRGLDHPNIVKAYEVYENKRQIFVVLENCSGGDLYARNPYSEKDAAKIVGKILSAVAYMHQHNIVHRDLKYENIMFENNGKDAEIKIIDFGLSKKYIPGSYMTEGVGTIYTMAPQVLQGIYTSQADMWSVGVIAFMLLSNSKPFYQKRRKYMINKIMRCDYNFNGRRWKDVSKEAHKFVSSLIVMDPKKRLNAKQALGHKWLSDEFPLSNRRPSETFMDDVHDNIISFQDKSEFKKLALMVIAHKSSTHQIVQLRAAFDQFDTSNDGIISLDEFREAMTKFEYSDEEIASLFGSVDMDKSGKINYTEFLAATLGVHGHIQEDRLAEAFDRLDADDTGYISKKNIKNILGTDYTRERVEEVLQVADLDDDGRISFEEFLKAVRSSNQGLVDEMVDDSSITNNSDLLTISAKIPGGK